MCKCRPKVNFLSLYVLFYVVRRAGTDFSTLPCAKDMEPTPAQALTGLTPAARFGWLGIIQHTLYMAGKTQYAITTGVLIHPGFVLTSADDISRIPSDTFNNSTKYIVWSKDGNKHVLGVYDYFVHPDYTDKVTLATIALVRLQRWAVGWRSAPVEPICMPVKGYDNLESIHVVKFSDDNKGLQKEILPVNYVERKECNEYYFKAGLSLKSMAPVGQLCTVQRGRNDVCLWDAGSVLITKLNYAYWTLLGFGAKGPGCGVPARFTAIHRLMEWIDVATSRGPVQARRRSSGGAGDRGRKLAIRQFSPYDLILYESDVTLPTAYGQCERRTRGNIQYKDEAILTSSAAFGLGVFFMEFKTIAQITCAQVHMRVAARTEAALWVEHDCVHQVSGLAIGVSEGPTLESPTCFVPSVDTVSCVCIESPSTDNKSPAPTPAPPVQLPPVPALSGRALRAAARSARRGAAATALTPLKKDTCFVYFKTTAYVEFRFRFSSKATITFIIYGFVPPYAPIDPWPQHITSTDEWRPTATQLTIKHKSYMPWFWSFRGE